MELWKELHERALSYKGDNDLEFLYKFASKVPNYEGVCRCREEWMLWVRANPPRFGPNDEYFNWTVEGHNFVNKKLGKPTYSLEEAKKFYEK